MQTSDTQLAELEKLRAEAVRLLRTERPPSPPLLFFLVPLVEWFEARHIAQMKADAFPDAKRAFNPVFIHLPAEGCRLTELATRASMTKQAMAELVDELVEKGYLVRFPDPNDGRAKIIVRAKKGLEAHKVTMRAFGQTERDLEKYLDSATIARLRADLSRAVKAIGEAGGVE